MIIIPAIDLRREKVVRLFQGRYDIEKDYQLSPFSVAEQFEKAGAKLIHLVDLDAARTGKPIHRDLILKLAKEVKAEIEVGGGIRTIETISDYLENGVSRVILGTAAHRDPNLVEQALKKFPKRIVIGIDAKEGKVAISGWEEKTGISALELAKRYDCPEVRAIIYTEIERDGTLKGPALEPMGKILKAIKVPVIASGGVSSINDLLLLKKYEQDGLEGVIVGKAIYEKKINLKEAIQQLAN
jgi:phosphoribosylformimino-5-aminoimidazole carboxamide ribotide isomerase